MCKKCEFCGISLRKEWFPDLQPIVYQTTINEFTFDVTRHVCPHCADYCADQLKGGDHA